MDEFASTDLQAAVAALADQTHAHAGAPAILLQAQAALGQLAEATALVTDSGRRPFRSPPGWSRLLAQLSYAVYQLADQTGVAADDALRELLAQAAPPSASVRTGGAGRHGAVDSEVETRWQDFETAELGPADDQAGWI